LRTASRQLLWLTLLGLSAFSGQKLCAAAEYDPKKEYETKAKLLYVFATLTRWSNEGVTNPPTPFILGILGPDPWNGRFREVPPGLKEIKGRPVVTKVFPTVDQIDKCDLLFIRSSEKKVLTSVLDALKGASVLTVAESKEFAQMGGVVNLYVEDVGDVGKTKFDVNSEAAAKAGLKPDLDFLKRAARLFPKPK